MLIIKTCRQIIIHNIQILSPIQSVFNVLPFV